MRPVEGRCLLDAVVDEPHLQYEFHKADLLSAKQREAVEVNEIDPEVVLIKFKHFWQPLLLDERLYRDNEARYDSVVRIQNNGQCIPLTCASRDHIISNLAKI